MACETEGRDFNKMQGFVEFIDQVCEKKGINPKELRMGSRRGCISQVKLVNYVPTIHIVMIDWYERTIKA